MPLSRQTIAWLSELALLVLDLDKELPIVLPLVAYAGEHPVVRSAS
jgi:hypothetical protein